MIPPQPDSTTPSRSLHIRPFAPGRMPDLVAPQRLSLTDFPRQMLAVAAAKLPAGPSAAVATLSLLLVAATVTTSTFAQIPGSTSSRTNATIHTDTAGRTDTVGRTDTAGQTGTASRINTASRTIATNGPGTGITTESPASLPKHRLAPASTARESVASAPPAPREAMDQRDMTGNRETKGIRDATGPHRTTDSRNPTKAQGTADARDSLDARDAIDPRDSLHSLDATETVSVDVKGVERVWRIRTHELEDPGAQLRTDSLDIQRSEHDEWLSASIDELLREAALRRTLIYVHGNRGADAQAVARGAELARQLAARPGAPPFQVVIWSWPSAKTLRGRRDFLHKSERTDTEAWYLAGLLQRFPSDANVSILGFSYGARVVTGAAQWLAGGRFEDRELPILRTPNGDPRTSVRLRVALAAPAMHWHWIGQDSMHNRALEVIDRMTILYNPSDPALRWFKLIYPCERPQALGRVGISDERLGAAATRVDQWNIEPAVGRAHDEELILRSPTVIELIGGALMDSPPSSVVEQEAAKR